MGVFVALTTSCGESGGGDGNDNAVCGNGRVESGETCDDGNIQSGDGCSANCRSDETCGNGFLDVSAGEDCDTVVPILTTCESLGFEGGTVACDASCALDTTGCFRCGDGVLNGDEFCDGADVGQADCSDFGFDGGALYCTAACTIDTSGCLECGDGMLNGSEQCDGSDLGTATCLSETGMASGELFCTGECLLDTAGCYQCGNDALEGPEICDGNELEGATCVSLTGLPEGEVVCASDCLSVVTDGCHECGNGVAETLAGEQCDQSDFGTSTCASIGYQHGGDLNCLSDCMLDTSNCCPDGTIGSSETCDDGNTTRLDGCHACEVDDVRVTAQAVVEEEEPDVALAPDGRFVVAYADESGPDRCIYVQRFDAMGQRIGAPLCVHDTCAGTSARNPRISMDDAGRFVVAWETYESTGRAAYARLFASDGTPLDAERTLQSAFNYTYRWPDVKMAPTGEFVATWIGSDGSGSGIRARLFDASGNPVAASFVVNEWIGDDQERPAVGILPGGGFVVAWASWYQDFSVRSVYARRFDAAGAPVGSELKVNTYDSDGQGYPAIAIGATGAFVITWTSWALGSAGQDGSSSGTFGQCFDAAGLSVGSEFQVNTFTAGYQAKSRVGLAASGAFVVTWQSGGEGTNNQDGSGAGIYMQRYNASCNRVGGETQVNRHTSGDQLVPGLAMLADGRFIIVWEHVSQDAVIYQRYDAQAQRVGLLPW